MPLCERTDYRDARFCGVIVSVSSSLEHEVHGVAQPAGFDFIVSPIADSAAPRPTARSELDYGSFTRQELADTSSTWAGKVVGLLAPWIELEASDEAVRRSSYAAIHMEGRWAHFIGLQAVLLPRAVDFSAPTAYGQVRTVLLDC